jgi:hypothetical protein
MNKKIIYSLSAGVIYACFAVYLYLPYFESFKRLDYLIPVNITLAAMGCFVLSRRWIFSFPASLFAGALYGFGTFVLSMGRFHPTAGFLAAMIGWLFCPAAYGTKRKFRWIRMLLSLLPFAVIILFFQLGNHFRLFAVPIQMKLQVHDFSGLVVPLFAAKRHSSLIGFYHVPIMGLVIGLAMLIKARRLAVVPVIAAGLILAFCNSFLSVSPVMWLSIPTLCCAVIIGVGLEGLAESGFADRKWVLSGIIVSGCLAILALFAAFKCQRIFAGIGSGCATVLFMSAKMYIISAISCGIIFIISKLKLRLKLARWIILGLALIVDIFLGAGVIIAVS